MNQQQEKTIAATAGNLAPVKARALYSALLLATLSCLSNTAIAADELPVLKKGLWNFQRSLSGEGMQALPRQVASKRCVDPAADMHKQNAMLSTLGCTLNPVTRQDNRYSFVSECPASLGLATRMASTIIVDNDSAYRVIIDSEANVNGKVIKSHEELTASRERDC